MNYTNILPNGTNYCALYQLNEPIQNIWFLAWILKKRGCDPYLNEIILSSPIFIYREYENRLFLIFKNYLRHGPSREWYDNGQVYEETNFINDFENGVHRKFYENGQLMLEAYIKNNNNHGLFRTWHENGLHCIERYYENGTINGYTKEWSVNGQLVYEAYGKKGIRHGFTTIWNEDGDLIDRTMYNNGYVISTEVVRNCKVYINKFC